MPGTVTVACKIPNGLQLQVWKMIDEYVPVMGSSEKKLQQRAELADSRRIKINGPARAIGKDAPHEIRNGVGLTHGVDADFFAAWLNQNKDSDVVLRGHVFAAAKVSDVDAKAVEMSREKTGLEPLDPKQHPDEFRAIARA
nr:hypothetical protein [uncultured Lichenicoccus sp.]